MGRPAIDLASKTFGRLTVLSRVGANTVSGNVRWLCLCSCGDSIVTFGYRLQRGETKSCGCLRKNGKHGLRRSPEWMVWAGMKSRCSNPKATGYANYGGRGIKICDRWDQDFMSFYEDMGPRPSKSHSIDRINNDGDYEPGNCRWATRREQGLNRRPKVPIAHIIRIQSAPRAYGVRKDFAEEFCVSLSTISRIRRKAMQ